MRVLLIIYDNEMHINQFPQGIAYIASVIKREGHDVEIYNQDKSHYSEVHINDFLNREVYDMVGVGIIAGYYQYSKILKISESINRSDNRPFYIIGGHGPTPEPEYFLRKTGADAIVMGEGELTIVELLNAVECGGPLSDIKGIAYRDGGDVRINKRRPLIKDVNSIPFPAYDLFPVDFYKLRRCPYAKKTDFVMPLLSGRGCMFKCNFCYRMDKEFRPRSSESIIEEMGLLNSDYGVNFIAFNDELLMSSVERTTELSESFLNSGLDIKWICNGRLNYAKPDVLKLMKRAGCVLINYGIESMDDTVLKNMNKALTTKQIVKGVEATLDAGISPGLNILFGNIGDNKETLRKGVEFLLKYDDGSQLRTIRPVTPYPGSPLYYYAIENGLLKDCEDFYENKHVNSDLVAVNFTCLNDDEFNGCLFEANFKLIENYYKQKLKHDLRHMKKLYYECDTTFRGFRQF